MYSSLNKKNTLVGLVILCFIANVLLLVHYQQKSIHHQNKETQIITKENNQDQKQRKLSVDEIVAKTPQRTKDAIDKFVQENNGVPEQFIISIMISLSSRNGGWSAWAKNCIKLLQNMNIPILHILPGKEHSGTPTPEDVHHLIPFVKKNKANVLAIVLQDELPNVLEQLGQIDIMRRVYVAPFFVGDVDARKNEEIKQHGDFKCRRYSRPDILEGITFLSQTEVQTYGCDDPNHVLSSCGRIRCVVSSMGIDHIQNQPVRERKLREERGLPVLYTKTHTDIMYDEKAIVDLLLHCKVQNYIHFRTSTQPNPIWKGFHYSSYKEALEQAPYIVVFTPFETYGYFLFEAIAHDIPVYLISGWSPPFHQEGKSIVRDPLEQGWDNLNKTKFCEFVDKTRFELKPRDYLIEIKETSELRAKELLKVFLENISKE